jgi:hypothetical protein
MIDLDVLEKIAKERISRAIKTEDDLIDMLRVWWSNKFKLPDNHPLFLSKTLEEHTIDYFTDKLLNNPPDTSKASKEQLEADDQRMKEEMGDEFHEDYDYLVPPTETELGNQELSQEEMVDIEEDFTNVRHSQDG